MKARILIILFVFISFDSFSQNDKMAQEILDAVSVKYKSLKSLKATFSIIIENQNDKSKQEQKGTLYLKGSKYKLLIAGQDIVSDGKTRWTYLKDANEIQIDNQKKDDNTFSPTNIFTIYEKGWQSKYTGEKLNKKITYQSIELIPLDLKSKNVFKVKLMIDKKKKTISSAMIYDKNGSIQTISVGKFTANGANEDINYVFNTSNYPGSEIVDLR